ncbi:MULTISPECIES: class I SAM-dependent methyltransferase [Bradyrhizobium]|jgi:SAM-dependent methyltransferase|uniref:class I SAM-dependent methyltransferase n=1 Tax=Bradyrhizobium TaxID=374 RepID=UPI0014496749|nr:MULTISPECIES: class I SAM-dependent methyltransferase [Bradyrhizobium]MCP1930327.1 SAM-dependent methyltransferase [Bradyrhizobium elkanii]MCS3481414.1 SAM-dependent methyltransferase [Bradyrhizobium elkanii]MCS3518259.1 SAM-dependent methyltransferase [Bradyrhizobium elkanii]MCS3579056.1 SAM-dependent methyltransferase [Bradyrhizobium elkanii]MCS3690332.1 SAM-dependent methyltransferase [Bradyrhizobium elkanii]
MTMEFCVGQHNAHYEGVYSAQERDWRRVCAVDKADHIAGLLGAAAARVGNVLEVGCGTGAVLARLSAIGVGRDFTGIDVIDPATNLEIDGAASAPFRWSSYDGTTIPFADGSFDLVYASHVLEHVPEPRALLYELARVSRDFIYVEVPCELHARTSRRALQSTLDIGHINFYTPDTFRLLLETVGLKVKDFGTWDHSLPVHAFHSSRMKGLAKSIVRKSLLTISPGVATRLATYHCGAICRHDSAPPQDR